MRQSCFQNKNSVVVSRPQKSPIRNNFSWQKSHFENLRTLCEVWFFFIGMKKKDCKSFLPFFSLTSTVINVEAQTHQNCKKDIVF